MRALRMTTVTTMPPTILPTTNPPVKSNYSEVEAAEELGITVTRLREMIRHHVVEHDDDVINVPQTSFQPSDLVILRVLAGFSAAEPRSNPRD